MATDDAVEGYIDAARQGARMTTFQGRVTNWRVVEVGKRFTNGEGDRSFTVLLADGRGQFAGGLLLSDGGSLFRGAMLDGPRNPGMILDAEREAEYWAQRDADAEAEDDSDDYDDGDGWDDDDDADDLDDLDDLDDDDD